MDEDKSTPLTVEDHDQPDAQYVARSAATIEPALNGPGKNKGLSLKRVVAIAALLLIGSLAATYYGIVVPNRPENVLKRAYVNTAKQRQSNFSSVINIESINPSAERVAVKVSTVGQTDVDARAFRFELAISVNHFTVTSEMRGIGQNLYLKTGNLDGIKSLVQLFSSEYVSVIDFVNNKLADQWFEVDEALLSQAGSRCLVDIFPFAMTEKDLELLESRYDEAPFVTIKSVSSDTVNGRSATKFELEIDDNKGAEFSEGLDELSVFRSIKKCIDTSHVIDHDVLADGDITPLTIWVDKKSTTISKLTGRTTKQDEETNSIRGTFEINVQYDKVNISKPEGARPITELIGELYGAILKGVRTNNALLQNSLSTHEQEL